MVVCKFFLQGTCKFGDYCKFEHQRNSYQSYNHQNHTSTSILRQPNFGAPKSNVFSNAATPPQQQTASSNTNLDTLVKLVVNDMTVAEGGGQWRLSCYGPFSEKPAFPGLTDQSFEEIRLKFYEARNNNTLEQYKQQWNGLVQDACMKLKALQNPSQDIVKMLQTIYNSPSSTTINALINNPEKIIAMTNARGGFDPMPFSTQQQTSSSIFATANQNLFGNTSPQKQTSTSIFGGGTPQNVFQQPTNNSPFGQQSTGIFGATPANSYGGGSMFQNNTDMADSAKPVFVGQQVVTPFSAQPTNIFANPNTSPAFPPAYASTPSNTPFASNANNPFTGAPSNQTSTVAAPSPFGQSQVNSPFGVPQASTNIFQAGQATTTNIFATPQPNTNVFGPAVTLQQNPINQAASPSSVQQNSMFVTPQAHTTSIFGAPQQSASVFGQDRSAFGGAADPSQGSGGIIDDRLYSKLEELTEDEIKWFQTDDMDIARIPDKPPTYEMCFKI